MTGHAESVRAFHAHQAARPMTPDEIDAAADIVFGDGQQLIKPLPPIPDGARLEVARLAPRDIDSHLSGVERQAESVAETSRDGEVRELARLIIQLITIMRRRQ